jgi:DNA-binding CsgD family transcriptional regulator
VADYLHQSQQATVPPVPEEGEIVLEFEVGGSTYTLLRRSAHIENPDLQLSPREKEIVSLIARGLPNKTIARKLNISPWTVSTCVKRIFAKFNVRSRAEMVAQAMTAKLM